MKKLILPTIALGTVFYVAMLPSVVAEGSHKGGHGDAHWVSSKEAAARVNPVRSDQASLDRGKQVFMTNCTSCRGVMPAWKTTLNKNQRWNLVNYIQNLKNHDRSEKNSNDGAHKQKSSHTH